MSSSNQRSEAVPQKILINPNFNQTLESQTKHNVHINPRFQQQQQQQQLLQKTPVALPQPEQGLPKTVHINPNFAARPLPDLPNAKDKKQYYVNPSFLDPTKAKAYDDNVKKLIESKRIFLNPKKFQPTPVAPKAVSENLSSGSSSEKENIGAKRKTTTPNASSATTTTSHCKKSLFKKIGTRKLIRVKSSSAKKFSDKNSSNVQKINSPIVNQSAETSKSKFRKIGTKKLVRVKSVGLLMTPPLTSPGRYKLRTKRKIIVKTPRSLFSTPFSLRRKRVQNFSAKSPSPKYVDKKSSTKSFGNRFSNMFSPFRVDRRAQITPAMTPKLATVTEKHVSKFEPKSSSNLEEKYKKPVPPKPARKGPSTTLINVQGVRYTVSDNGRKLNRVETKLTETPKLSETPKSVDEPTTVPTTPVEILPRKLYLDGEEYIEDEPGVLIRSRNSMTRQSITSYKNRSINTILKSQTRSKQYCMFYNKFGKCNKRDKGMCPYIHDASKVAVCRKFLQANCLNDKCLLSHQVAPDKMPSCKFFIQGLCTRDPCPYRHVHVNSEAEVCPDFLKGFCPAGAECKKKHFYEKSPGKPEKPKPDESFGEVVMREKKIPPAKPKRKSICQTPLMTEKKARVRYYDEKEPEEPEKDKPDQEEEDSRVNNQPEPVFENSPSYEQKRKRLLRKVELAKQGWTGMAILDVEKTGFVQPDQLDESGPYEEIPDDDFPDQKTGRAPIGRLPSYISLDSSKSVKFDDNLTDKMTDKMIDRAEENVNMDEKEEEEEEEEAFDERLI